VKSHHKFPIEASRKNVSAYELGLKKLDPMTKIKKKLKKKCNISTGNVK